MSSTEPASRLIARLRARWRSSSRARRLAIGISLALTRTGGNSNGKALAAQMEKFKNVPTLSGLVTFSKSLHTVSGRTYRVIRVTNNTPETVGVIKAKVVPKI